MNTHAASMLEQNFCTGIRKSLPDQRFKRYVSTFPPCRVGQLRWPRWIRCRERDAPTLQINLLARY